MQARSPCRDVYSSCRLGIHHTSSQTMAAALSPRWAAVSLSLRKSTFTRPLIPSEPLGWIPHLSYTCCLLSFVPINTFGLFKFALAQSRRALTKMVTRELLAPGVLNSFRLPGKHSRTQETYSELSVAWPAPLLCKGCRDQGSPCIRACVLDCGGPLPNQPEWGTSAGLSEAR